MKKNKFFTTLSILFILILCAFSFVGCTDYSKVVNDISLNLMSANVKIQTKRSGMLPQGMTTESLLGSGVIIGEDGLGHYFVLTNYHVVDKANFQYIEYEFTDYKGNAFSSILSSLVDYDKDMDVAILQFSSQDDYSKVKITSKKQNIGTPVFAVGSPDGQINSITIGSIISVGYAPEIDDFGVLKNPSGNVLQVYLHNAQIQGGSSGGMLLNEKLELVGINYAGVTNVTDNSFVNAYSIPIYEIIDFIRNSSIKDFVEIS